MTKWTIAGVALLSSVAFAQGKPAEPAGKAKPAPAAADKAAKPEKAGPMEMPKPGPELDVERWFVGNWKCEGTQHAGPMGPEAKYVNSSTFKMSLGGFWLEYHIARDKMGEWVSGYATWDGANKRHQRFDLLAGGGWATLTTPGFEGDKMVSTGDMMMMGKKMAIRHTIVKKGDAAYSSVFEHAGPDGKLMVMSEEECKKAGGGPKK